MSLISPSYIVSFNELTLKLKIIGLCDVKHIKTLPIKTNASVLKVLTYIIISITCHPMDLAAILSIMSISTFKLPILYIYIWLFFGIFSVLLFLSSVCIVFYFTSWNCVVFNQTLGEKQEQSRNRFQVCTEKITIRWCSLIF